MIRAYVNERGIVLRFDSLADKPPTAEMEALLDELKSHYIPSFYQHGKRCYVDFFGGSGKLRIVIYFTSETVTMDEAIRILKKRNDIEIHDVREGGPAAP
jgi:hypothetical protein